MVVEKRSYYGEETGGFEEYDAPDKSNDEFVLCFHFYFQILYSNPNKLIKLLTYYLTYKTNTLA